MTRQRDKPLSLGCAEPRPGWCSTATKESVLRLASSNVSFHRRIFRQQCEAKSKSTFRKGSAACMGIACQRHGRLAINLSRQKLKLDEGVRGLVWAPGLKRKKPIYNPQEELMDLDLQEEIGKLVGPRLMTQRAHDIERIMSSVARLTSSSIDGLENLTPELHDLQKFLQTEVARVQSEVDNAMAGIKIIMEAIAPLRSLQTSATAGRIIRSGPRGNLNTPPHQAPALT